MNTIDIVSIHNYIIKQYGMSNKLEFYYYLLNTLPIIDGYMDIKKKCKKIYFMNNPESFDIYETKDKMDRIVKDFQERLNNYFPNEYQQIMEWKQHEQQDEITMKQELQDKVNRTNVRGDTTVTIHTDTSSHNCLCQTIKDGSNHPYSIHDNNMVCELCGVVSQQSKTIASYKDIDRINLTTKYSYDRKTHFRDCISQFQGKQNSYIPKEIYDDIYKEMIQLDLIPDNFRDFPKEEIFKKITKEQILLFMKQLGYSKYYEDITLIYHEITGKPTPDITYLENDLLKDFDTLTELYDRKIKKEKKTSRKNFINTQYVLYQLLRRHRYPCKQEDFNILKTIDLKYHHDTICQELFQILNWNFNAIF